MKLKTYEILIRVGQVRNFLRIKKSNIIMKVGFITRNNYFAGVIFRKNMMSEWQGIAMIVSATFGSGFYQIGNHFRTHLLFCIASLFNYIF